MKNMLGTNALAEVAGPLKDFFEKLGGDNGVAWLGAFKRFLRKEDSWSNFSVWKTIILGTHKTLNGLRNALKANGDKIGDWANDILNKVTLTQTPTTLNLVIKTTKELTGKDRATTAEVFRGAARMGLEKCPAQVGPDLRDQYGDQPNGELLLIGMDLIAGSYGNLNVFYVGRFDGDRWLRADYDDLDNLWVGGSRWVFVLGN